MLIEGLKITLIGMGTVFVFLTMMVCCLYLMGKVVNSGADREPKTSGEDENIPAVIAGAIARFKKDYRK